MPWILHVDMDAFFASVEARRRPELLGLPVIIGGRGDPSERGVVSTASYEARRFGVRSGMPLRTACRLCPEGVFLPVDMKEYSRVSEQVKAVLREFSPVLEDAGMDEAFLELPESESPPEVTARELKRRIESLLELTCSVGIGPNKLLAKMASDLQKPDGLTVLTREAVPDRVWPLPVRKLPGVGPKTEKALSAMRVRTIGDVAALELRVLVGAFGRSRGEELCRSSRGEDDSTLVTQSEPRSLGRELTFQRDVTDRRELAQALRSFSAEVARELRDRSYRGRTVTVKIRFSDFETLTRSTTLEKPTRALRVIRRAAFECLRRFELKKPVRLAGLRVEQLRKTTPTPPRRE